MYTMNKYCTGGGLIRGLVWTVGRIWSEKFWCWRKSIKGKIQAELCNELLRRCGEPFNPELLLKQ